MEIGIRELKEHLSEILHRAKGIQAGWLTPAASHKRQVVTPIKPKKIGKTSALLKRYVLEPEPSKCQQILDIVEFDGELSLQAVEVTSGNN